LPAYAETSNEKLTPVWEGSVQEGDRMDEKAYLKPSDGKFSHPMGVQFPIRMLRLQSDG
jgi:hypothetical protein